MKTFKLVAVAGIVALAGCSSSDTKDATASNSAPSASASAKSGAAASGTPYGTKVSWKDGVELTASKPASYTFSDPHLPGDMQSPFKKFVVVEFTLANHSKKFFSPTALTITASANGKQSDAMFDADKGSDLPTDDVMPGKTLTWKEIFGVDDDGKLTMTVTNANASGAHHYA